MNLIADLATPPAKRNTGRSVMDEWLDEQNENIQAAVKVAAANHAWGHVALRDKLHAYGAPKLSDTAIREWRKKHGWNG